MADPIRCHLLIGPLTTVAGRLLERLKDRGGQARGLPITNDLWLRRQDCESSLGLFLRFEEIDDDVPRHLLSVVARGRSMVVDGTPVTRQLRQRYLKRIGIPKTVQWIGWWIRTPQTICRIWNRFRLDRWNSELLEATHLLMLEQTTQPCLSEGFHALVQLDPSVFADAPGHDDLDALIDQVLDDLDNCRGERTIQPLAWSGIDFYRLQIISDESGFLSEHHKAMTLQLRRDPQVTGESANYCVLGK